MASIRHDVLRACAATLRADASGRGIVSNVQVLALIEEVMMWRADCVAACRTLQRSIQASEQRGEQARATDLRVNVLMPRLAALRDVLGDADWHAGCEGCDAPILPGELVIQTSEGEMHAACFGIEPGQRVAGARIAVDADDLERDEDEAPPADPHLTVFASADPYDPDEIDRTLAEVTAFLHPQDDEPESLPLFGEAG